MAVLPKSKFEVKKSNCELNPIPYPELEYLSGSAILVSLRAPNKQYFNVQSASESRDHISNSQKNTKVYYISVSKRYFIFF